MFGDSTQNLEVNLLSDLTLDKVDFDWIKNAKKISHLKKALKLIEEDGDYYPDLKKQVIERITEIDPK